MRNKSSSPSTRSSRWSSMCAAILALVILVLGLLSGCSKTPVPEPENALPEAAAMTGWTPLGNAETFDHQTLFNYIDGASDYFFTYGFEKVATRQYQNTAGLGLVAEIWRLTNTADAYGLFSGHAGAVAVSIGHANEALLESGSRIYFWQNRFYIVLTATTNLSDEDLEGVALLISNALPTGGSRPALVGWLPSDQLVPGSAKYFHEELAIQDQLWLGGENLLGLGQDTNAVYGLYQTGSDQMKLLLVQFPNSKRAAAGLQGLKSGGLDDLVVSDTSGSILGAVFGNPPTEEATKLLSKALGK